MFDKIKDVFNNFFKSKTYKSELERYICSRNPQSVYDVERLTKQFSLINVYHD